MATELDPDGAERIQSAVGARDLGALREIAVMGAGVRLSGTAGLAFLLAADGPVGRIATQRLKGARPVRAVMFDKTPEHNWSVAWHQDRTIAVRERVEAEGYGPWSLKGGVVHVEPPFAVLAGMLTIRVHLDDCDAENAPLLVARGSHRWGRVIARDAGRLARDCAIVVCLAAAGDAWVYRTPVLHASDRALRPCRRRVLQIDYAAGALAEGVDWRGIG